MAHRIPIEQRGYARQGAREDNAGRQVGVPCRRCTAHSRSCTAARISNRIIAMASHAGSNLRRACVTAPQKPETTTRNAVSANIAERARRRPARKLVRKKMFDRARSSPRLSNSTRSNNKYGMDCSRPTGIFASLRSSVGSREGSCATAPVRLFRPSAAERRSYARPDDARSDDGL